MKIAEFRSSWNFTPSPTHEMFEALRFVSQPQINIHTEWHAQARATLAGHSQDNLLLEVPLFWKTVPHLLGEQILTMPLHEVKKALVAISAERWQHLVFSNLLRSTDIAQKLVEKYFPSKSHCFLCQKSSEKNLLRPE